MSTIWAFDHIENKQTLYRGKDCMYRFCETLRKHQKKVIDFEKKKVLLLLKDKLKSQPDAKVCYVSEKQF